jgi:hypothetical protein
MTTQEALFGDPATIPDPDQRRRGIDTNDVDLVAGIIRVAADPGYMLVGPTDRVFRVEPGDAHTVEPVPRYEQDAVRQLLDAGHLTIGGAHTVTYGDRTGPAHSVLIPKATRAMAARWAHLRPLIAPTAPKKPRPAGKGARPSSRLVHVDVVSPGKGLVTCGQGDFSGVIIRDRDRGGYQVETEHGDTVGTARSYRHGASVLARHHGYTCKEVDIQHEKDPY